jgi:hypothetical protein
MLDPPYAGAIPSKAETLDQIGAAFRAALERDGSVSVVAALSLVSLVLVALTVRWIAREARKDRIERQALDARHVAVMSSLPPRTEQREWVVVPAHLRLSLHRTTEHGRVVYEDVESQSVSAGSIEFLSHAPPAKWDAIWFTLFLGEGWPLSLRGVVESVESSAVPRAAALVTVKLGPISNLDREHLVRWVAQEDARRIAEARRGRVCAVCERPLADDRAKTHATCSRSQSLSPSKAPASKSIRPRPTGSRRPLPGVRDEASSLYPARRRP